MRVQFIEIESHLNSLKWKHSPKFIKMETEINKIMVVTI